MSIIRAFSSNFSAGSSSCCAIAGIIASVSRCSFRALRCLHSAFKRYGSPLSFSSHRLRISSATGSHSFRLRRRGRRQHLSCTTFLLRRAHHLPRFPPPIAKKNDGLGRIRTGDLRHVKTEDSEPFAAFSVGDMTTRKANDSL